MFLNDELIVTLKELGLTLSQAKVYAVAAKLGKAKAKDLWQESGVGRQELYRILNELSELGLVEREISTPTQFISLPLSKGSLVLLSYKRKEVRELETKTKRVMEKTELAKF